MANPPSPANVKLLCHFDGSNGATTTVDSSPAVRGVTLFGTTLSTAQAKFGASSILSDAAKGAYVSTSSDFAFGAGQFTIEAFVYFTGAPGSGVLGVVQEWEASGAQAFFFGSVTGALAFYYSTTGSDNPNVGAAWTPTLNVWYHIAVDRDASNILRVYLNGVVHASATVSATIYNPTGPVNVGSSSGAGFGGIVGHIDEVRIVKGEAVYGGAFTPPAAPFTLTAARVSQLPVEVLRTNTGVKARVSQLPVEVLRINTGTIIRTSQIAVEVLRPNAANASTARPVVCVCT